MDTSDALQTFSNDLARRLKELGLDDQSLCVDISTARICFCSVSVSHLFGYEYNDLLGSDLYNLLPSWVTRSVSKFDFISALSLAASSSNIKMLMKPNRRQGRKRDGSIVDIILIIQLIRFQKRDIFVANIEPIDEQDESNIDENVRQIGSEMIGKAAEWGQAIEVADRLMTVVAGKPSRFITFLALTAIASATSILVMIAIQFGLYLWNDKDHEFTRQILQKMGIN